MVTGTINGIIHGKPDISKANPKAFTWDTTHNAIIHAPSICPSDLFRTTLSFSDPIRPFIDTTENERRSFFDWESFDPRVRSVVWQVSVFPFPVSKDNWTMVPGLLAQGNLDGNTHKFSIDFSQSVPTESDAASIWSQKKTFLTFQENSLLSLKNQLNTASIGALSLNTGGSQPARQKQLSAIDSAISQINTKIAQPAQFSLVVPKAGQSPVLQKAVAGKGMASTGAKYSLSGGVSAPVLIPPDLTKSAIAGTLPQVQRTFFVRVIPFDATGNYTGNPSNEKEVVIGEPVFNTTGPWSGWEALSSLDQSGFGKAPEVVSYNGRMYFFNVRDDHHIFVNSIDATGTAAGWSEVPGSFQTDGQVTAVVSASWGFVLGPSWKNPSIYLFATTMDQNNPNSVWYTRLDEGGTWDSWKPIPQTNAIYRYTLEKAAVMNDEIYVVAKFFQRKYIPTMSYDTPAVTYVFQRLTRDNPEKWESDWINPQLNTNDKARIIGSGEINSMAGYVVEGNQDLSNQPHVTIYATPTVSKPCSSCNPAVSVLSLAKVDIPASILESSTDINDLTATTYHGRLYLFVRGKQGHIYAASMTVIDELGSGQHFGSLRGWVDITPKEETTTGGIRSVASMSGDRLEVFARDITQPTTGPAGWLTFLGGGQFFGKSSVLYHDSLGKAPDTTQLLASFTGQREKVSGDFILTGYRTQDINISWTRPDAFWFAWNSSQPDLAYAEWQVSVTPFDEVKTHFQEPGIVAHGRLDVSHSDPNFVVRGTGSFVNNALPEYTNTVHLFPINFHDFATASDPNNPSVTPYYLRVISVAMGGREGEFIASASPQTEVDWGPQFQYTPKFCTPPTYYDYNYQMPRIRIIGYTPINRQQDDYYCHGVVTTGYSWWMEYYNRSGFSIQEAKKWAGLMSLGIETGTKWYLCNPPEHHWYDDIVNFFESIFNFFESIVDAVANIYNGIKGAIIAGICDNNPTCETVLSAGVDIGLAAIGVPPTIPNFNQLMDQGVDYLAATVADESGIPLSDVAAKQMMNQISDGLKHTPNPNDSLGIQPDPDYQYQPARLKIEIYNSDPVNVTPPGAFRIHDALDLFKTDQPSIPFPSLQPGQTITFPVVLRENQWSPDMSCTECVGNDCWAMSCDDMNYGKIDPTWWANYQAGADSGNTFNLYYDGLSANFTKQMTKEMEKQYGVPLNTFQASGPMDYQKPDCFADKYGLIFMARDDTGNLHTSYSGWGSDDPLDYVNIDSTVVEWNR
jgi:hypothetical protein